MSGGHITSAYLRGRQITFFFNSVTIICVLGLFPWKGAAGAQRRLHVSENIHDIFHSFCLPQLFFSPRICVFKKAMHDSDDKACFFFPS